jgi:hypothetical protein
MVKVTRGNGSGPGCPRYPGREGDLFEVAGELGDQDFAGLPGLLALAAKRQLAGDSNWK